MGTTGLGMRWEYLPLSQFTVPTYVHSYLLQLISFPSSST